MVKRRNGYCWSIVMSIDCSLFFGGCQVNDAQRLKEEKEFNASTTAETIPSLLLCLLNTKVWASSSENVARPS